MTRKNPGSPRPRGTAVFFIRNRVLQALLLVFFLGACAVDPLPPPVEPDPLAEGAMAITVYTSSAQPDAVIRLDFEQEMDAQAVFLGGDMEPESDGGIWTNSDFFNDTLVVSPVSRWSPGPRTLEVSVARPGGTEYTSILFFSF